MNIYKPFDYAIYMTIRTWSFMGVFHERKMDYFKISGFISTFQILSLIAFEGSLIGVESMLLKMILFLGGWNILLLFNFFRYKNKKMTYLISYWNNETTESKRFLGFLLAAYFSSALICIILLTSN